MSAPHPQIVASDPEVSAFVTANAGAGKTRTLVDRVARLLLRDVRPEAILCVTFTKAAAAEMQRRLFETLGAWAVMDDERLAKKLTEIEERPANLSIARALFARALETPGGLKIQTIHAFCEKLLRRFPLEAGVPPGFRVLEDQAAREVSARARDDVAQAALEAPDGPLGRAYARFAVELAYQAFNDMFATFEARRTAISAYVSACGEQDGVAADVWRLCGFDEASPSANLAAAAVTATDWPSLLRAGRALLEGSEKTDRPLGERILALTEAAAAEAPPFEDLWRLYCTQAGKPLTSMATKAVPADVRDGLAAEQARLGEANERIKSARVAEDTIAALTLAAAYAGLYGAAKASHGGLDFADLIARTRELLTIRADAAWVLFKMDGGIDHVLVDEAQDTAPDQWAIVRALTSEFFVGAGARDAERTVFAVGDEKQSIFSFQDADPERFLAETLTYQSMVTGAGRAFKRPSLIESWRSAPEVLAAVDAVFADPAALSALRPGEHGVGEAVVHRPTRDPGHGCVELWPPEEGDPAIEADPWEPVDAEPAESGNRKLARRLAQAIKAMQARREAVFDKDAKAWRPLGWGDVLILVRRRSALFHEIIRALKREGVPVGGADRLTLSDHIVFDDLIGLARVCLYPWDDLELAALLRSPLFDVDEDSLYALAQPKRRSLWAALEARAGERPQWLGARDFIVRAQAESRSMPPFDFYARLLNGCDAQGRSMRARLLTRLGREAEQALDAFLAQALAAERRGARDLESFAADMAASEVEVKREQDEGKGEVRVMTVHGAKGLEAPVVILPDTTTRAAARGGPLLSVGEAFLWSPRKADDSQAAAAARQERSDDSDRESLRLLYVAMTRARDRLIVCGVMPGKADSYRDSWHDYVRRAFEGDTLGEAAREVEDDDGRTLKRFGADPVTAISAVAAAPDAAAAPVWLTRPAPAEPPQLRYASPSRVAETSRAPSPSPLADVGGLGRFRRGDLIHRLLQLLPDVATAERTAAARRLLEREGDLNGAQRDEMAVAALKVLQDDRFAAVFGPGSKAEVAIAGSAPSLPEGLAVSGRIDRLLVEADRVLVADFKTNRPSPDRIEDADPTYVTQMALYAAVLGEAFPGRRIEAALVWTDGPKLMAIPENMMAKALQALPRSG